MRARGSQQAGRRWATDAEGKRFPSLTDRWRRRVVRISRAATAVGVRRKRRSPAHRTPLSIHRSIANAKTKKAKAKQGRMRSKSAVQSFLSILWVQSKLRSSNSKLPRGRQTTGKAYTYIHTCIRYVQAHHTCEDRRRMRRGRERKGGKGDGKQDSQKERSDRDRSWVGASKTPWKEKWCAGGRETPFQPGTVCFWSKTKG